MPSAVDVAAATGQWQCMWSGMLCHFCAASFMQSLYDVARATNRPTHQRMLLVAPLLLLSQGTVLPGTAVIMTSGQHS